MPKEITTKTTVYKFDELSEEAKEKAIESLYDINVDFDWWDSVYDDAEQIGCKIEGFDLDRGNDITFTCRDVKETVGMILKDHGEACDTYKLAEEYIKDHEKIMYETEKDEETGDLSDEYAVDQLLDDLDHEFERALGEEYLSILRQEYDYLTSKEAIIDTIEANDYDFTEEGRLF